MELESCVASSSSRNQFQVIKRKDSERFEIVPIENQLSFEEGFHALIRASQLLSQKNDGVIFVGLAGPSGAGKSVFTEKIHNLIPSIAIINMESYTDATRLIDADFDDSRLTDYDTLVDNINGLKDGKSVQVPVYDFKSSSRIGYRTLEVPSSRIVILEGIYALSEKLRPLLDLRVSITGGVPFNLVKRIFGDIYRAGQDPQVIINHIFEMVYPMHEALIEPDLKTAHIKIENNFNPFSGFENATYILKSTKAVTQEQMKAALSEDFKERNEETCDIYLLPPGDNPESCQSYIRMRSRDGKYNLVFEEWVTDPPFILSPRITCEVNFRLLGGLMELGYTIATTLKRKSHIFDDDEKVIVKIDCLEQQTYVQVRGRDRSLVENVANQLGLEGSYVPHTYIEHTQLERLVPGVTGLPDDLKTKLSLITIPGKARSRAPPAASPAILPNQGVMIQLLERISTVKERIDEFASHVEEWNRKAASGGQQQHTLASPVALSLPSSSSQLGRESALMEAVARVAHREREIMKQVDTLSNLLREHAREMPRVESTRQNLESSSTVPVLLALAIGCVGILAFSCLK